MAKMSIATANLSTSHNQPPSQHPSQGSNSLTRTSESEPRPGRNNRVHSFSPIQIKLSSERVSTECNSNRKRAGKSTKALTRANTSPQEAHPVIQSQKQDTSVINAPASPRNASLSDTEPSIPSSASRDLQPQPTMVYV